MLCIELYGISKTVISAKATPDKGCSDSLENTCFAGMKSIHPRHGAAPPALYSDN
jgi:hypothetical protein